MSQLVIHLFGLPRIEKNGVPISVDTRKAIALAAYLAVTEQAQERHHLTGLLWAGSHSVRAKATLRRTISVLKQALTEEWLVVDQERIQLNQQQGYWVDVNTFRQHLAACQKHGHPPTEVCATCVPHLVEAASLYQNGFMADFYLQDSVTFDTWQITETESLRREQASALQRLIQYYVRQQEFETAVTYARQWLMLDPTQEMAHRWLMEIYARMGQRSSALHQYEECVHVLNQTLGVLPAAETTHLYEQIRLQPGYSTQATALYNQPHILPTAAPASNPPVSVPHLNLPTQLTPCIGREIELTEINERLALRHCRLLTILGMGGIGKTHLAIQVATQQAERYAHGVFFVALASIESADLLVAAIADALKLQFSGSSPPQQQLLNYLQKKEVLILLDNFEHLLDGADLLLQILHHAPQVKILVTSRVSLNFQAEWLYELQGLTYPEDEADREWGSYHAVQLFMYHTHRVHPHFVLDGNDRTAVSSICNLLQGLPLGIELAAALMRTSTAPDLAAHIHKNLTALETYMRDVPPRHRSLRAVFTHSWHFLSATEQITLSRLSVFRGTFTADAAREVAQAAPNLLSALRDKSFLHETPNGRFGIHSLLQQFAYEQLCTHTHEALLTQKQHSHYFISLLHHSSSQLKNEEQAKALQTISKEIENVRASWQFALSHQDVAAIQDSLDGLFLFYDLYGWYHEGADCFAQAINNCPTAPAALRGTLLIRLGSLYQRLCSYNNAKECLQTGMALLQPQTAASEIAFATYQLGIVAYVECDYPQAEAYFCHCLTLEQDLQNPWLKAHILNGLGSVYRVLGQYDDARQSFQTALALRRQMGDCIGTAVTLNNLGALAEVQGAYDESQHLFAESLELKQQIGDIKGIAHTELNLGYVLYRLQKYDRAKSLLSDSLSKFRDLGIVVGAAMALTNLGNIARAVQDYAEARRLYQESLFLFQEIGDKRGLVFSLTYMGNIANTLEQDLEAKGYFAQALTLAADMQSSPQIIDVLVGIAQLFARQAKVDKAVDLLQYVLSHPASVSESIDKAHNILKDLRDSITSLPEQRLSTKALPDVISAALAGLATIK